MARIKLIAVDLDDTLLTGELKVSPRVKAVLRQARVKGVQVTLATGRMYASALPYAEELGIDVPLITYQGALVKSSRSGEVIIYRPLPLVHAREIIGRVRQLGYHINAYVDDRLIVERMSDEGLAYARLSKVELQRVPDLVAFLAQDPTKLVIIAEEEQLDALQGEMTDRYGDRVHVTKSKPQFLEFSHPLATKGRALADLAARLGIKREEVMAIGDSYNDLEMIAFAGIGVVMGNAREEIKARADYITSSNDEDGVAEAVEKFVLRAV